MEPPAGAVAPGVAGDARHGCDFQHLHRNKRSLSLDLKAPGAREVLMRLVDTADVLIENMRAAGQPPDRRDMARVEAMIEACFTSDDYREGQRAFAEKRPPHFTGR